MAIKKITKSQLMVYTLLILLVMSVILLPSNISASTTRYEGKMIDVHAHPIQWDAQWMIRTLEKYKEEGVYKIIFFDGDAALQASKMRPNEIIPSQYMRHMDDPASVKKVENALEKGYVWIGEALLRHHIVGQVPADHPVAMQIYDLCVKYDVPITIHQDPAEYDEAYEEFENVAKMKPNCIFVLHGWWLNSRGVERILNNHPNVYLELAGELEDDEGKFLGGTSMDKFAYSDGRIKPHWKSIFEKYQDRIISGFDFWLQWQYSTENLRKNVDYWRNILGQIEPEAAEKIAYKNVENLLAKKRASTINFEVNMSTEDSRRIEINGEVLPKFGEASLSINYLVPENSIITHEITTTNCSFEDSCLLETSGEWSIYISWEGNNKLLGCESQKKEIIVAETINETIITTPEIQTPQETLQTPQVPLVIDNEFIIAIIGIGIISIIVATSVLLKKRKH